MTYKVSSGTLSLYSLTVVVPGKGGFGSLHSSINAPGKQICVIPWKRVPYLSASLMRLPHKEALYQVCSTIRHVVWQPAERHNSRFISLWWVKLNAFSCMYVYVAPASSQCVSKCRSWTTRVVFWHSRLPVAVWEQSSCLPYGTNSWRCCDSHTSCDDLKLLCRSQI